MFFVAQNRAHTLWNVVVFLTEHAQLLLETHDGLTRRQRICEYEGALEVCLRKSQLVARHPKTDTRQVGAQTGVVGRLRIIDPDFSVRLFPEQELSRARDGRRGDFEHELPQRRLLMDAVFQGQHCRLAFDRQLQALGRHAQPHVALA